MSRAAQRAARAFIAALACLPACAAAPEPARAFAIELSAQLPDATPLAGVRFWLAGHELGPTDGSGRATVSLSGHEGDPLAVSWLCPAGYRGSSEPRRLRLQALAITLRCEPESASAALVVRALRGESALALPILVDGRVMGQTDASGVAHVLLHGPPGDNLQVRLDTSSLPELRPRDPVRVFDLESNTSVLLFDQPFTLAPPERKRGRVAEAPHPRVPYRIE